MRIVDSTRTLAAKVVNVRTQRVWMAVVLSMALFTALFWLMVAARLGTLEPRVEGSGEGYATAVAILYFLISLVGAPVAAHTVGYLLEHRTEAWSRDDAVVAFAGLGLVLAAPPVLILAASEPAGAALGPAIWLFGLPVLLATTFTRFFIDSVIRSQRLTRIVAAVAFLPPVIVVFFLLGLYVARGSGQGL
ncbi:MAG: hypothetical protein JW722_08915 [Demequinaceae bacterium]|nr:hypothetical protein [Demequinaceae bacterium]